MGHKGFTLQDDGTLDTVVRCDDCDEEIRFDSAGLLEDVLSTNETILEERRVENAMELAHDQHECGEA